MHESEGALRIGLVIPRFGATTAVLAETPFMLVAGWWVCLKCIARFRVRGRVRDRLLMGSAALVTLLAAEMALAAVAFGQSPTQYVLSLGSLPGVIGLTAQIAFTTFPVLQAALPFKPPGRPSS